MKKRWYFLIIVVSIVVLFFLLYEFGIVYLQPSVTPICPPASSQIITRTGGATIPVPGLQILMQQNGVTSLSALAQVLGGTQVQNLIASALAQCGDAPLSSSGSTAEVTVVGAICSGLCGPECSSSIKMLTPFSQIITLIRINDDATCTYEWERQYGCVCTPFPTSTATSTPGTSTSTGPSLEEIVAHWLQERYEDLWRF